MPRTPAPIALWNDWLARRTVEVWDPADARSVRAGGLGVRVRLAHTPAGAAIHADLDVAMAERARGDYHALIDGAALTTHLAAYNGQVIYEVATSAAGGYSDCRPLRVVAAQAGL